MTDSVPRLPDTVSTKLLLADSNILYHITQHTYVIAFIIQYLMNPNQAAYAAAVSAVERLIAKAKQSKSTSLKSFIVALYTADDQNPLRFSGKIGMLQIDFDRSHKLHFIRFYDIQTLQMLFEVELFYGFGENYHKGNKQTVYLFDLFADGVVGFQFRNKQQAELFALKVKAVSPKNEQFRQLMKDRIQKQLDEKKNASFFGKIKKKFNSIMHEETHQQESIVLKVQKQKSITMNFSTGQFDFDNAPADWEEFLNRAGIGKQELKDKQVLKLVFQQTVLHQAKKAVEENPDLVQQKHLDMIKEQIDDQKTSASDSVVSDSFLPPPPPIPGLNLQIPTLSPPPLNQARVSTNRAGLMEQIRKNNLKLKPVKTTQKGVQLDLSSMNKQERHDLAEHIRMKLQKRKLALNRRKASDASDDDE